MTVGCPCCLREERWTGTDRHVVTEGGRRKPDVHPVLAAWRTLRGSLTGATGPVVAACPACGQPMVAEGRLPRAPWTLALPGTSLLVTDRVIEGDREVPLDEADRRLHEAFTERLDAGKTAVQGAMLLPMFAPMAMWPVALFVTFWILFNAMRAGCVGTSI